jgi:methionyl-tRNA formyltransferase
MVDGHPGPGGGSPALRIVFFGTPQFAVPSLRQLLASRHPVVGVVTQPDRPRGRGQKVNHAPVKATALEHGIAVIQPDRLRDPSVAEALDAWQPDLGVVAAYGRLVPEAMLAQPRFGMINVHASLLPKYRGAAPVHRAVIDGERETGVTIMRVVKALDAGAMFATARRPIGDGETSDVVERDLAVMGAALLVDVIEQIVAGTAREEPQDDRLSTYAPRLTKDEGLIDWSLTASAIHNRVRGLYPWPHAYTHLDGRRLIVLETRPQRPHPPEIALQPASPESAPSAIEAPGTIAAVTHETIEVATGHGGRLAILALQPEGRRPMRTREFLAGHPVPAGARLA